MKKKEKVTQQTLHALFSGRHPLIKKYAGRQVFVVQNEIIPLREGKKGLEDFHRLKEKYKESPILTFVPRPGATYILILQ